MGSTRLANLPDEAQLASARHRPAATAQRAARAAESERRIPIRPNYHCTGSLPNPDIHRLSPRYGPPSASTPKDIATGTRRKWGEPCRGEPMVTRDFRGFTGRNGVSLPPFGTPVAGNPRSHAIAFVHPGIFLTVQGRHRLLRVRGAQRKFCNVRDNDCDDGSGRRRNLPRPCVRGYPFAGVTAAGCVYRFVPSRSFRNF